MIGNEFILKRVITEILFDKRICESSEDVRVVNFVYNKLFEAGLLVGEPLTIPELRQLLLKRIVNFEFIKIDGEVRPATGTTNMKYIPKEDHPKGVGHSSPKVATFYDLKKNLWRSVSQKSKEIVLKSDEPGKKPIVTVSDVRPEETRVTARFKQGKTYAYVNRRGESGHTATVLKVGEKGYYLKLDAKGPMFYLTFDTADKRMRAEIKPKPTLPTAPISPIDNRAVAKVKDLINEPPAPPVEKKPLDVRNDNKVAYDVKDDEIKGTADNIIEPIVTPPAPVKPEPTKPASTEEEEDETDMK
jgi:hypothetical protein